MEEITANLVKKLLPKRDPNGHKGTFGKVRIWGGAVGYTGAPVYAGEAACRTGSGLVFVAVPGEVYPIAAARCDTAMVSPAPEEYEDLRSWMSRCDAALIGPGLGRASDTERKVRALLEDLTVPVVLDADGINAVGTHIDSLASRAASPQWSRPTRRSSAAWAGTSRWAGSAPPWNLPGAAAAWWCSRARGP